MRTILILCLLFLASCNENKPPVETKPTEPVVITTPSYSFKWDNEERTKLLIEAIKKIRPAHNKVTENFSLIDMKPSDWHDYIDVWPLTKEGVAKFWGNILVTMAKYESNWNSETKYQESFRDNNGNRIWSRGLFQLSIESGRGYGCDIKTDTDLHKDKVNIDCAVQILAYWVKRDAVFRNYSSGWRGAARYWAVVRGTSSQHTKDALAAIKKANR